MSRRGAPVFAALLGLLLTTLLAPLTAAPAAATGSSAGTPTWRPMQVVGRDLSNPLITSNVDGSVRGVVGVPRPGTSPRLALLHRSPEGGWSTRGLPFTGAPLAVADDGRTTFLLWVKAPCSQACEISIAKVPHGGAPSAPRLLDRTDGAVAGASLLARDGRWWAVWSGTVKQRNGQHAWYVHDARTLGASYGTRNILSGAPDADRAVWPHLVFRGRYQALLTLDRQQHLEFWVSSLPGGTLWRTPYRIVTDSGFAGVPSAITTSGIRTIVAYWRRDGRLIVAHDNADLRFTERTLRVAPGDPAFPRVATSLGRIFVSYGGCRFPATQYDCRGHVATGGLAGGFSVTDVTAPLAVPQEDDGLRAGIVGLTAARGRATVLFTGGRGPFLYARAQR